MKFTLHYNKRKGGSMRSFADTFVTLHDALFAADLKRKQGKFPQHIENETGEVVWSQVDQTPIKTFLSS